MSSEEYEKNKKKLDTRIKKLRSELKTLKTHSVFNIIKKTLIVYIQNNDVKFDNNNFLFAFKNGVYDLETKKFRKPCPEEYITKFVNYEYRPSTDKEMKVIDSFLTSIMPDDRKRRLLISIVLTCIIGMNVQKFFIFIGEGGNGKSTLSKLL